MQYNALGQEAPAAPVRLPVGLPTGIVSWAVSNADGVAVPAQLVPLSSRDAALRALYGGSNSTPVYWLCFEASVPAAGYSAVFLEPVSHVSGAPLTAHSVVRKIALKPSDDDMTPNITNGRLTLTLNASTGFMSAYTDAVTGISVPLLQTWLSYIGFNGNSSLNGSNQAR